MFTVVAKCKCSNEYQDLRYGAGMRVHNVTGQKKKESDRGKCCTSCGLGATSRQAEWKKFRHRRAA